LRERIDVAAMSHGIAANICKPMKRNGNVCDKLRHDFGASTIKKRLILLRLVRENEPAIPGLWSLMSGTVVVMALQALLCV
jgi:hypothetical protein